MDGRARREAPSHREKGCPSWCVIDHDEPILWVNGRRPVTLKVHSSESWWTSADVRVSLSQPPTEEARVVVAPWLGNAVSLGVEQARVLVRGLKREGTRELADLIVQALACLDGQQEALLGLS